MRRVLKMMAHVDLLEVVGFGFLALLAIGLWQFDPALAFVVVGALGFGITVLAIRNRKGR